MASDFIFWGTSQAKVIPNSLLWQSRRKDSSSLFPFWSFRLALPSLLGEAVCNLFSTIHLHLNIQWRSPCMQTCQSHIDFTVITRTKKRVIQRFQYFSIDKTHLKDTCFVFFFDSRLQLWSDSCFSPSNLWSHALLQSLKGIIETVLCLGDYLCLCVTLISK